MGVAAQGIPCGDREEGSFIENPLPSLNLLRICPVSTLVNLIEALNYFYKFGENSQGLPIIFSTTTKIVAAN